MGNGKLLLIPLAKPMKTLLRIATLNDLPTLLKFEQGVIEAERPFNPTLKDGKINYYNISELINNDESEVFVAEIDGNIVASGYAKIKTDRPYLKHSKQGYLGFMFVDDNYRGQGLNRLINNALFKWCKSRNVFEIKLDVYNDNISAIKAYEKVGFKKHMINMRLNIKDMDV